MTLGGRTVPAWIGAWAASRILCWAAGVGAVVAFGAEPGRHDPFGYLTPFGDLGDKLVAPAARWDAHWFLLIADHGYAVEPATHFYPIYPYLAKVVGLPLGSALIGGILVSLAALLVALYLLERLAERELGPDGARRTVLLMAFFPTAVFFSAVYSEALLLALSVAAFLAARNGRWAWAGLLGCAAAASRPQGFLVFVPLLLLYLYGPRDDRADPPPEGPGQPWRERLRPRYALRPDAAWLLAVPAGLAGYAAYLWAHFDDPFVLFKRGEEWHIETTFPLLTVARAVERGVENAPDDVYELGMLALAVAATWWAFRRLPLAYGAYAAVGIVFLLCFPVEGESLSSFSRYVAMFFPVVMAAAAWAGERRLFKPLLVASALVMAVNAARFATWHFVA